MTLIILTFFLSLAKAECDLQFKDFDMCAEIDWPLPPQTLIDNHFTLNFFYESTQQPVLHVPKLIVSVYNFHEQRWTLPPDIAQPKNFSHIRYINNLFFDKPGYWKVFFRLQDESRQSEDLIKVQLESF